MPSFITLDALKALPWRLIGIAAVLLAAFSSGCQVQAWKDATKEAKQEVAEAKVVTAQAIDVAKKATKSGVINNEVSRYIEGKRAAISSSFNGMSGNGSASTLRGLAYRPTGAAQPAQSCVSSADYDQLKADAADDAVILLGWQKWYADQCANFGGADCQNQPE